ncbi:MAG: YkvA family protein [Wenzhouxiangella sp.]
MSLRVTLDFTEKDLEHFRNLARQAMASTEEHARDVIITAARNLLRQVDETVEADYIRTRLGQLQVLIDMLEDEGWGMKEVGQKRVLAALAYFNNPEDLIPDHIPGVGFLDDAIMVELLTRELKPEIDAYRDFVKYREAAAKRKGVDPSELNRADFIKNREQALLSRMRRRRRGGGGGGGGKSPFSLF